MVFGRDTVKECQSSVEGSSDAIFQHADAVQHLAEALEDEVSSYAKELAARISMLHASASRISDAGLEIARAGHSIAECGEHLALALQQSVRVAAAGLLTVVAGLFGWRYLLLGALLLRLMGFQILWSTKPADVQQHTAEAAPDEGPASAAAPVGSQAAAMQEHIHRLLSGDVDGRASSPDNPSRLTNRSDMKDGGVGIGAGYGNGNGKGPSPVHHASHAGMDSGDGDGTADNGMANGPSGGGGWEFRWRSRHSAQQAPAPLAQPPSSLRRVSAGVSQPPTPPPQYRASLDGVFVRHRAAGVRNGIAEGTDGVLA